jgi:flagellar protein FlaG
MGIISSLDNTPPKPKEIINVEQKANSLTDKIEGNQQSQAKQTETSMSTMKQLLDVIADSSGINMSMARISFSEDKDTGDIVIKIIDNKTDEVIKQIPPEEVVELRKRLGDLQGLMIDKKA